MKHIRTIARERATVTRIKLTIIEPDEERHELVITMSKDCGVQIHRIEQAPIEADAVVAINVGNQHCKVCMDDPDAECETARQILVLRVEVVDGES
jgi:hypothetical protein